MAPNTCGGPGYATPMDAFKNGNREKIVYVPCIVPKKDRPDYLSTIDVDPSSSTYGKVLHRLPMTNLGDEIHHTGWNACSSCHGDPTRSRSRLIVPGLGSDRVYIVDTSSDPLKPKIDKVLEPSEMYKLGCSTPHTSHCLGSGDIMISTMGDGPNGNAKGDFVLIDGKTFEYKGTYLQDTEKLAYGYDFWYQPYHNVMISTEYGHPKNFKRGLDLSHVESGQYGTHLNVFDWKEKKLIQKIDVGLEGVMPLEIRFLHNPKSTVGFVGSALFAKVFMFDRGSDGKWSAQKVIDVPSKTVEGWILPEMNGTLTDIILSMDDKYLYFSNWLHGDIRQYDITDPKNPKLAGQIFLGGLICKGGPIKVTKDSELAEQPELPEIKGKKLRGGPQMIQLSLDGKRLYVTNSLLSPWDKQFYPEMVEKGSMMYQIDVDTQKGGLTLNKNFLVDFADEPEGPALAHEIRYPGGDCTSDIYLVKE